MPAGLVVATANVLSSLDRAAAGRALQVVLAAEPDLVALQEWWPWRRGLLPDGWHWSSALIGGTVVGARRGRFTPAGRRRLWLDPPGRAENERRPWGWEPPRIAVLGRYADRDGGTVSLVSYHLVPGAERGGRYREDRPRLAARHAHEVRRLEAAVAGEAHGHHGHTAYAAGDANFDRLPIEGLVSAWTDRPVPGTLNRRTVDDVHGPRRPDEVDLLDTGSDHRAVVATWSVSPAG